MSHIGFMQGRLSPMVEGKIQAFPWEHWQQEFQIANKIHIHYMDWTIDQEGLIENPLMTETGQSEILYLCEKYDIKIPSLTGDCFMQFPFWKQVGDASNLLKSDFLKVVKNCSKIGIKLIVVPLVDNGAIENVEQEDNLINFLKLNRDLFLLCGIKILFESSFNPKELSRFIKRLDPQVFGINYDIGNSAAFGFDSDEELSEYGDRILNVHVKDRKFGGTTVKLGAGDANFAKVFTGLSSLNYMGNFILQTARADDDGHASVLSEYRDLTMHWLKNYAT